VKPKTRFIRWFFAISTFVLSAEVSAELADAIERIKPSIVVVGTYKKTNSPQFVLRGTGFVIGNGNLIATNSHVVPDNLEPDAPVLVIQTRSSSGESQVRRAFLANRDKEHDLAVLRFEGAALPALKLRNSDSVREGQAIAFTGFPIGGALGFSPVTHRGMISSITPIALPGGNSQQLNEKLIRRIKNGTFNIFQLDATAYPGNSGSPVFDIPSGEVIGVINMVFIKGSKEAALSQPSGISYAIPANFLQELTQNP
jgi:serine protease Do